MATYFEDLASLPYPIVSHNETLSQLINFTLHPIFPTVAVVLYLICVTYFNSRRPKPPSLHIPKSVLVIHNLILAVYSLATFIKTAPLVYGSFWRGFQARGSGISGFRSKFCDVDGGILDELMPWAYVFYLSKFYEFLDTVIILVKGKKAAFLQEYHHAGAIFTMWTAVRYRAFPVWIFCVFNSGIHTIMYTYYTILSLDKRVPMLLKQILTSAQITQLVVGGSLAASYLFVKLPASIPVEMFSSLDYAGKCLTTSGHEFTIYVNVAYLTPLTYLFASFWLKSYGKKANKHLNGVRPLKVD